MFIRRLDLQADCTLNTEFHQNLGQGINNKTQLCFSCKKLKLEECQLSKRRDASERCSL